MSGINISYYNLCIVIHLFTSFIQNFFLIPFRMNNHHRLLCSVRVHSLKLYEKQDIHIFLSGLHYLQIVNIIHFKVSRSEFQNSLKKINPPGQADLLKCINEISFCIRKIQELIQQIDQQMAIRYIS